MVSTLNKDDLLFYNCKEVQTIVGEGGGRGEGFIAEVLPSVSGAEETGEEQEEGGETEETRAQVMYIPYHREK